MSNKNMFLYWGSGSSPCWKAMIVLAEKGLWEGVPNKLLEWSKMEHKSEEVLKLNPRGQVGAYRLSNGGFRGGSGDSLEPPFYIDFMGTVMLKTNPYRDNERNWVQPT